MKVPHNYTNRTSPSAQPLSAPSVDFSPLAQAVSNFGARLEEREAVLFERNSQTERFETLRNFSEFETQADLALQRLSRTADPSGKGFTAAAEAEYAKSEQAFIAGIANPQMREEFKFRSAAVKGQMLKKAMTFQYAQGDTYFRQGVKDELNKGLVAVDQAPDQLESWQKRMAETIAATDLTESEKVELGRQVNIALQGATYKAAVRSGVVAAGALGVGGVRGEIANTIDAAAKRYGVNAEAAKRIAWLESKGDPNAKNPRSSAGGLFQFIDGTAKQYGLKNKFDPAESADAAARLQRDNEEGLRKVLGREPTIGELYLAHQQGLGGAVDLLSQPDRPATEVVGSDAVRLNGGAPGMTAGQFASLWIRKAEGARPDFAGSNVTDPRFADIPFEDRVALREDAERDAQQLLNEQAQAAKAAYNTQYNTLKNGIIDGTKGMKDIDDGYQDGWLNDADDRRQAIDLYKSINKDKIELSRALGKAGSNHIWDPYSEEDKGDLNHLVGKVGLKALAEGSQEYVEQVLRPLVQRAHDIPTSAVGTLTGMIRGTSQQRALFALDTLRQLREADPRAFSQRVDDKTEADVDFYTSHKGVMAGDQLLSSINGGATQEERQRTKELREEAKNLLSAKSGGQTKLTSLVASAVDDYKGFWRGATLGAVPWAAQSFSADYQTLFTDAYVKTGDEKSATELALKGIRRLYSPTNLGQPQLLMKLAPEVTYSKVNNSYDWIDKQAREGMKLFIPGESYQMISDDQTASEYAASKSGGPPPSYQMIRIDPEGVPHALVGEDGKPFRMNFIPKPEDLAAEEQAERQKQATYDYDMFLEQYYTPAEQESKLRRQPVPKELRDQEAELRLLAYPPDAAPSPGESAIPFSKFNFGEKP